MSDRQAEAQMEAEALRKLDDIRAVLDALPASYLIDPTELIDRLSAIIDPPTVPELRAVSPTFTDLIRNPLGALSHAREVAE